MILGDRENPSFFGPGEGSNETLPRSQKTGFFRPLRCEIQGEWGGSAHYPDPTAQSAPAGSFAARPLRRRPPGPGRGPVGAGRGLLVVLVGAVGRPPAGLTGGAGPTGLAAIPAPRPKSGTSGREVGPVASRLPGITTLVAGRLRDGQNGGFALSRVLTHCARMSSLPGRDDRLPTRTRVKECHQFALARKPSIP